MFFVFNPISFIICMQVSFIVFFTLYKNSIKLSFNNFGKLLGYIIILTLISLLSWLQMSIFFNLLFDKTVENFSSLLILLAFPIWSGFLTFIISKKII